MTTDRLRAELRWELSQLARLSALAQQLRAVPVTERRPWDVFAAATLIGNFYEGFENLLRRRLKFLDQPLPAGADSHTALLEDFLAAEDLGQALPAELADRLHKYRIFRHRYVHSYGFELTWETVDEPLRLLPDTIAGLTAVFERWMTALPD